MNWPVVHSAAGDAKNTAAAAQSSGRPVRPRGMTEPKLSLASCSEIFMVSTSISVTMMPGAMQLTVMPLGASSTASVRVMLIMPMLAAE